MKLLFDCTELSYFNENSGHRAGVFYVALNLFREFRKQGVDITFYCDFKRYYFMKDIKEFSNIKILNENSFSNRVIAKLLYISRKFPQRMKNALLILARLYDKYCYKINKKNSESLKSFDVYFSPFTPPSLEIEQANLKRFRMVHDVIPIIENGYPKSPVDWYYKIYSSLNNNDFYFTNSEFTKRDILKYFPQISEENICTSYLGACNEFYPDKAPANLPNKYIFSLCTLGKRKNIIFSIENFFKFIKKNKIEDLYLVLGGGIWKNFEQELESILKKYDRRKIILTGYIEENNLRSYYSNALCFLYPSLYEGFGLPVLEAMQCGCPVITSNTTSLPEIIGNSGIKINPTSGDELVNAFEKMYTNEEFRKKCSVNGINLAKTFSWERCANTILNFMNKNLD